MISHLRRRLAEIVGREISAFSRYYDRVIQWRPLPHDDGAVLDAIECPVKERLGVDEPMPTQHGRPEERTVVLLNGNFNHHLDIQGLLAELKPVLSRNSRVALVAYNPYLRWVFGLAERLGLRRGELPGTFVTRDVLANLARLAGYEIVRLRPVGYVPQGLPLGLGRLLNRVLPAVPLVRWLSLTNVIVLRPIVPETRWPSLSIIIPARNERGNIEAALQRLPTLGEAKIEVIFVEGHSTDGTWEEIKRVEALYCSRIAIKSLQQTGKGKNDAVRLGMAHATGELVTILDADLTMPPEMLGRFYEAWRLGQADFVNGNRLVYPMEHEAMQFLNWLGNQFFAKALSLVLDVPLGDCLCGTKLLARHDYRRMQAWREVFGDFDPFGDFEFLFPAAELALGVADMPIHYKARVYGTTNISRFTHGWMLLKMTAVGLWRVRMGKVG